MRWKLGSRRLATAIGVLALVAMSTPAAVADNDDDDLSRRDILFGSDRNALTIEIYAMRSDGTDIVALTDTENAFSNAPAWSPDSEQVVFHRCDFPLDPNPALWACDIWVMNADGTGEVNLTNTPGEQEVFPRWSPNGKQIVFMSATLGFPVSDIFVIDADGSNVWNVTNTPAAAELVPDWSPNGKEIVYTSISAAAPFGDIIRHKLRNGRTRNLTKSPTSADLSPVWSPDGRKIAFVSNRPSGGPGFTGDIYVMEANGRNVERLTESALDFVPRWSGNGKRIFFDSNRDLIAPTNCLTPNFGFCTQMYVMNSNGSNETPILVEDASIHTYDVRRDDDDDGDDD